MMNYDLITILGPTASGKTTLAVKLAHQMNTEIISADSRQVYKRMDIGTGKDLADYKINGYSITHHLIDIAEPGTHYNVYEFQRDFLQAYQLIRDKNQVPILCGGSGLYLESIIRGYRLLSVPENQQLRAALADKSLSELTKILAGYKRLHNTTDVDTAKRAVRAIEIEEYYRQHKVENEHFPSLNSLNIGVSIDREFRREKITQRLRQRLDAGMIDEVQSLLNEGLQPEDLIYYGLEYKYVTLYIIGELSFDQMFRQLEIAIHQFAKRQMTWFRGMERRGCIIHWLDASLSHEDMVAQILDLAEQPN